MARDSKGIMQFYLPLTHELYLPLPVIFVAENLPVIPVST